MHTVAFSISLLLPLLLLSPAAAAQATKAPAQKTERRIGADTFARGLAHPWGLAFLPDGRLLVTERPGRLRIVGKNGELSRPVGGVPAVDARGQGGLLDLSLAPDFASSRSIRGPPGSTPANPRAKPTPASFAADKA